jgi:biopolymer transport protein ExbB
MRAVTMKRLFLFLILSLISPLSHAWWNGDWASRVQITLDTSASGVETKESLANVPVLVRLHTGNFDFLSAKVDGSDIRFVDGDDKTPLKFHIEKFDSTNNLALIWVEVPKLQVGNKNQHIWLYSGNDNAPAAGDAKATYDGNQTAVYHFAEIDSSVNDSTGNGNNATGFMGKRVAALIGGGVEMNGQARVEVPASPSLKLASSGGFTFTVWVKPTADNENAVLFAQRDGGKSIVVGLDKGKLYAEANGVRSTPADLPANAWSHVAVTLGQKMVVYVNGNAVAEAATTSPDMAGAVTIGQGFVGEMDEADLSNVARSADLIKVDALGQGEQSKLAGYGKEESSDSSGESASYFGVILKNVTLDGWVVIVVLMVMMAISWLVMAAKAMVIGKTAKSNAEFLDAFRQLRSSDAAKLDAEDDPDEADLKDSALLTAMFGKHDHYQNSSLYRIYHAGIQELKHRFGDKAPGQLSVQAIDVIKATLDGTLVRENQKLNNLMVLLTIAISGGPFLGLLGTVVGVMITFAAIAATGDVNIAAIAPGIAAALVATVAGLAVAIPALFGYNYLGSRIKSISADMHVFVDEFIAKIAEAHA